MTRSIFPVFDCIPAPTERFYEILSDIKGKYRNVYVYVDGYTKSFHDLILPLNAECKIDYILFYRRSLKIECYELHGFYKTTFQNLIDNGIKFKDAIVNSSTSFFSE